MEYNAILSNIYSSLDQLFSFNVIPAESTQHDLLFNTVLCLKCARGTY